MYVYVLNLELYLPKNERILEWKHKFGIYIFSIWMVFILMGQDNNSGLRKWTKKGCLVLNPLVPQFTCQLHAEIWSRIVDVEFTSLLMVSGVVWTSEIFRRQLWQQRSRGLVWTLASAQVQVTKSLQSQQVNFCSPSVHEMMLLQVTSGAAIFQPAGRSAYALSCLVSVAFELGNHFFCLADLA